MCAFRFFKRIFIQSSSKVSADPSFLNILMTDVRPVSVQQKLLSFYALIDRCLNSGRRVNLVVVVGRKSEEGVYGNYSNYLNKYLANESFNLVLVKPSAWSFNRVWVIFFAINYFVKLRGSFAQRINFACLSALSRDRIRLFQDVYDVLPCNHWMGFTGGVELPALKFKRDRSAKKCFINALQFGQASLEQQHFSGYNVDNFFVYDDLSRCIYQKLNMQVRAFVVTGSPEFEYHTSLLCDEKLLEKDSLSILFVDQPVQERSEYTQEYLRDFYSMLGVLNSESGVTLEVKLHPRGSAFCPDQLSQFSIADDWSVGLSNAHVVIGFFSNLCDLALQTGRITFYLGSTSILDQTKQQWVANQGGYVTNDINSVKQIIDILKSQYIQLADEIRSRVVMEDELPSELIYKKMVACSETETVP